MVFAAVNYPYVSYATASVRLRAKPSSSATILDVVQTGEAVKVTGTQGSYKAVEYQGKKAISSPPSSSEEDGRLPTPKPADAKVSAKYTNSCPPAPLTPM